MSSSNVPRYWLFLATRKNLHSHSGSDIERGAVQVCDELDEPWDGSGGESRYDAGVKHRLHSQHHSDIEHFCRTFSQSSISLTNRMLSASAQSVVRNAGLQHDSLPIFTEQTWLDGEIPIQPKDLYLEQPMRLASGFVAHWKAAPFWCALVSERDPTGQIEMSKVQGVEQIASKLDRLRRNKSKPKDYEHSHSFSTEEYEEVLRQVQSDFPTIIFRFGLDPDEHNNFAPCEYMQVRRWYQADGKYIYTVRLHQDIRTVLRFRVDGHTPANPTGSNTDIFLHMMIRFNFMLASLLTAAIAVILDFENGYKKAKQYYQPPYIWFDRSCHNVGVAAMQILFGGTITPIAWRCDTMLGLARTAWVADRGNPGFEERSSAIPIKWIAELQQPACFKTYAGHTHKFEDYFYHSPLWDNAYSLQGIHNAKTGIFGSHKLQMMFSL